MSVRRPFFRRVASPAALPPRRSHASLATIFALLVAALWTVPSASAATTYTWNIGTTGTFEWDTPGNWVGNAIAEGAENTADFSTKDIHNAGMIVNLATSRTIGTFKVGDTGGSTGSYTFSTSSGAVLTLDNGASSAVLQQVGLGSATYSIPILLNSDLLVNPTTAGSINLSGGITSTGTKNLTLTAGSTGGIAIAGVNHTGTILNNGAGAGATTISGLGSNVTGITQNSTTSALTLSGDNSAFAGTINLSAGSLILNGATSLGTSTLNIAAGTTLTASATTQISSVVAQNWNGGFTVASGNTLNLGAGAISLGADVLLTHTSSGALTFGGAVTGSGNLSIYSASTAAITFAGAISHTGDISTTRTSNGTTTFSGNVTNAGNITFAANGTTGTTVYSGFVNNTGTISDSGTGTANFQLTGGIGTNVGAITHASAGIMTLGTGAINNSGLISNTGGLLVISGNLGSTVTGVTQNSATGTTTLSGTNTNFGGPINLTAGTLKLGTATALGGNGSTTGTGGALIIAAGTTIDTPTTTGVTLTTVNAQTWNGDFTYGGTGSLVFGTGAVTMAANVQLSNNGTSKNLTVGGGVTSLAAANLTVNNTSTGATTFSGLVNNSGTITLSGAGTGSQTFSGGIGSNVGNILNSSAGAATFSGLVNNSGTITLSGTGSSTFSGGIGSNVGNILNSSAGAVTLGTTATTVGNSGSITNAGSGSASLTINGAISSSVTSLIQNSATSKMIVQSTAGTVGTFISGTGTVQILQGTLQAAGNGGSSIVFGSGNVFTINAGATLELNNTSPVMAGINDGVDGGGSVTNVFTASSKSLNLRGSGVYAFSGSIANPTSGVQATGVNVALTGGGKQTFSGDHTYTGATAVNLGTLALTNNGVKGSLGGTVVTVGTGTVTPDVTGNATLKVNGNYTLGSGALGTLTLAGGNGTTSGQGTLDMVDGVANTLTLSNSSTSADVLKIGGTTGAAPSILNLEVGATSDLIAVTSGKVYFGPGLASINLTGLGNLSGTTQTLISGAISGSSSFRTYAQMAAGAALSTSGNFSGYQVALSSTVGSLTLTQTANAASANAYYNGAAALVTAQGGTTAFNSFVNGNTNTSNFGTGAGGTGNMNGQLALTTNVFFDTNLVAPLVTSLGQNLSINSLNFNTASAVTIGGADTLTIQAGAENGNTLGNGLTVASGSGNHLINSKIALGENQTWTVTDVGTTLIVSNEISGVGRSLTKAGAGTLTVTGTSTYTGATNVNLGTLIVNGSLDLASLVTVSAGATFGGSGTIGDLLVEADGTHAPGNSPGVQTVSGNASYASGSTFAWELNQNIALTTLQSGPTYAFDQVAAGSLSITSGAIFTLTLNGAGSTVDFSNGFWAANQQWLVFAVTGAGTGNFTLGAISADSLGQTYSGYGSFDLQNLGGDLYLNWNSSVIPEPNTLALLGIGLGALAFFRRRR